MSTLGIFNTSNFNPGALPDSFAKTLLTKYPFGQAQFFALSAAMPTDVIGSTTHTWMGRTMDYPKTETAEQIAAGVKGASQVIAVSNVESILPKDILLVNGTDEQLYVESVTGDQTLIVRRGMGHTPPSAIPAGTTLTWIGNAHEEASLRPMMRAFMDEEMSNKTQIFRNAHAVSGTATAVDVIASLQNGDSNIVAATKKEAAHYHAMGIEFSLLFGEMHVTRVNGQPMRKMDGVLSMLRKYAPENIQYAASTTTKKQLDRMLSPVFNFITDQSQANDRVLYTGNAGMEVIQDIITNQGSLIFDQKQTTFGLSFKQYALWSGGVVNLVIHPMFNLNPEWSRMALVLDPSSFNLHYLRGRKTRYQPFNQGVNRDRETVDNGIDAEGGDYLTELTMSCICPSANGVIYGLCQAACDVCVTAPTTYDACFSISNPCADGPVDPGQTIQLQITGGKPESTVTIITPTGEEAIELDVNGFGAVNYEMPTAPDKYAFYVKGDAANANVHFSSPVAFACIAAVEPVRVESNSPDTEFCVDGAEAVPAMTAIDPTISEVRQTSKD